MPVGNDVQVTTHPNRGALTPGQRKRAGEAIARYSGEAHPGGREQLIAKSLEMAREGRLGERGGYHPVKEKD